MIINTKYPCDNQSLLYYFKRLQKKYPFFHYQSIGKSVLGNDIYCGRLGYGRKNIFIGAAFHSLEWITTLILLKFIEDYCNAKVSNKTILGHSVKDAFAYCSIYLVPLVNPDGVDLVLHKPTSKHPCYQQIIQMVDEKELAHVWQANIRGVDLNHNYDAGFFQGKALEKEYGILGPGPTRFGGEYPESEPETQAICKFIRSKNFSMALAYHAQGSVIYWKYGGHIPPQSEEIVKTFSSVSGYLPDYTDGIASYRGFKDWFIQEFDKPAFTIEVGIGKNPLPISHFDGIYLNNRELLILCASLAE